MRIPAILRRLVGAAVPLALALSLPASPGAAQGAKKAKNPDKIQQQGATKGKDSDKPKDPDKAKDPYVSPKFWESTDPFPLTLTVNMRQLQADKGDPGPWRDATISYQDATPKTHGARVRTRGRSRLKLCDKFPPIWVDLDKSDVKGTSLQRLRRFKLVSTCKSAPEYERYIIGEYNVYRIHQLFTPISHRVRLVKLTVKDSASGKESFTKFAFAVEDIEEVAARLGGVKLAVAGLSTEDLAPRQTALMGVLQYMVANTDFSFSARHNLEFVAVNGPIYPIIFDYDQSGVINTVYSLPDPSLGLRRVTDRLYRGLCVPTDTLNAVIADIVAKRPQVEALYRDSLGMLMGSTASASSIRFLNGFYSSIDSPKKIQKEMIERCAPAR
jgi:hypothetical protein